MEGGGWRFEKEGGGWRVEGGGWRVEMRDERREMRDERREGVLLGLGGMREGPVVDMGDLISRD